MTDKQEQPVSMEPVAWQERQSRNVNPQGVITSWSSWYQSSGLPKGYVKPENPRIETTYDWRPLYTAAQLAAARQQGAEDQTDKTLEAVRVASERIAELEQKNAQLLEALKELYEGCIGFMSEDNYDMTKARAAIAEVKP